MKRTIAVAAIFLLSSNLAYSQSSSTRISISSPIELSTITPAYPCGTVVQELARGICTVYTPNGPVQGNFRITPISNKGGGQCGITVYQIDCL